MLVAAWPDWPVVAAGCPPDEPAAVVAANVVVAVTAAARTEGVVAGLRRREAQRRCPELAVLAADPGRDARRWEPVVAAVETLTPFVEVVGSGRLCLGTRGPSRYFGGDAALARRVAEVASAAAGQPGCRVGVADGHFAASLACAAGGSEPLVIPSGRARTWLAPQPVAALGPAYAELADLLVRLGIRTLGDLAALPAASVLGRFGPEGMAARRLALGLDDRPFEARTPPPDLICEACFDPPEERVEAAAFVAKSLADELLERLGRAGLAAASVAIEVETEHGERLSRRWRHDGLLNASALSERARWQLDGWLEGPEGSVPTGGLTLLRLIPVEVAPDSGRQSGFWGQESDADRRAARAMARVQGILGPEGVCTAVVVGGRGSADQVRLIPWGDARPQQKTTPQKTTPQKKTAQRKTAQRKTAQKSRAEPPPPWPGRLPGPAPVLVHQPALDAHLLDSDGRPVQVSGRGVISATPARMRWPGGDGRVVAWAGPWPVEERWWDGGGRRRARVQVVLDDGSAHVVHLEKGGWCLEASYG